VIRDITLGQYINAASVVHRLDARFKMICTLLFIVMLFVCDNLAGILLSMVFSALLFLLSRIPLRLIVRSLRPIVPIVLFTAVLNLLFTKGDTVLFSVWRVTVYVEGVWFALMLSLRIVCLIAGSSLLTYTTSPLELTFAMEKLMAPLKAVRLPVHELAMMMSIALRFIPTLIEETDKIMSAQKSRGANLDTGKLTERVKALIPVPIPLFISAFRRADELALAMECRCYRGGEGRTRLREMRYSRRDLIGAFVFLFVFAAVVATRAIPDGALGFL